MLLLIREDSYFWNLERLSMSKIELDTETRTRSRTDLELKRPPLYKVLLHNDDYTTMELVVYILEEIFNKTNEQANQLMMFVHQKGSAIAGTYTFEIAESKQKKAINVAKENNAPLKISIEKQ